MPVSIRLDVHTERVVRRLAKRTGRTASDVIRQALATLDEQERSLPAEGPTAYERWAHLIGRGKGSGDGRLSENTGKKFKAILLARARARRSR